MDECRVTQLRNLKPGQYFLNPGSHTGFLKEAGGKITRLHDAEYVTGFFKPTDEVVRVDREVAVAASLAYRKASS